MRIVFNNQHRYSIPKIPFDKIKDSVLGGDYNLTLNIVSSRDIADLNARYRGLAEPTDILSFPLDETTGEIYMCPALTRTEAKKFDRSYENFFAFLFIHGCTHLKGYEHSDKMERSEARVRKIFGI